MDALLIVLVIQASAIDDDMESRICGRTLAVSMSRRRSQIHGVLPVEPQKNGPSQEPVRA